MHAYDWKNPKRPPFFIAFAADTQGCAWHRILLPAGAIVRGGYFEGRVDNAHWSEEAYKACNPDVIVFQRQMEEHQVNVMANVRQWLPNCHIVYEVDDLLSEVPAKNFHAGAMPPGIDTQVKRALSYCDAATVTTPLIKEWLESLGAKHVTVMSNLMIKEKCRAQPERKPGQKVRIGWGGGMSHGGDLELIKPAMARLGNTVEWVFLGFRPEGLLPVDIEFHDPCSSQEYTDKLYSLNVDVFLAPLEMNRFNEAKSNLRLIESGACGGAVIAQNVSSYRENSPPVFRHCVTAEDWTDAIEAFVALPPTQRRNYGLRMKSWTEKYYTFDNRLEERARAWMPKNAKVWRSVSPDIKNRDVVVCQDGGLLERECDRARNKGAHVLWARPGVKVTDVLKRRLIMGMHSERVCATIPLAPDGLNAFPNQAKFQPVEGDIADAIDEACAEMCAGLQLRVPIAFGPCVMLRAEILSVLGAPDVAAYHGNVDAAIMEWTSRASLRGCWAIQMADSYAGTVFAPMPASEGAKLRMHARGVSQASTLPMEGLPPERREAIELMFFRKKWDGLRPNMCGFKDDYVTHRLLGRPYVRRHPAVDRVTGNKALLVEGVRFGEEPKTQAPWIIWLDDNATLTSDALDRFHDFIVETPDIYSVYGDHEFISPEGVRVPFYKPDLDVEYLLSNDYVTPAIAIPNFHRPKDRLALFRHVLHDVLAAREADMNPQTRIGHLRDIVVSLQDSRDKDIRMVEISEHAEERAKIVKNFLGDHAHKVVPHPYLKLMGYLQVTRSDYSMSHMINIIVPTKGDPWLLHPCLNSILQHTDDVNYRIIVVNTGDDETVDIGWNAEQSGKVMQVRYKPEGRFNWSAACNAGVAGRPDTEEGVEEYHFFFNDDAVPVRKDWMRNMLSHFQEKDVGAVGAKALYPHGYVQHVGLIANEGNIAFLLKGIHATQAGYHGLAALSHENLAVTGACMLTSHKLFKQLGGFRTDVFENYADVDYCIRLRKQDICYRSIVCMGAEIHHREYATRGSPETPEAIDIVLRDGHAVQAITKDRDPYWPQHFSLRATGVMTEGQAFDKLAWVITPPKPGQKRVLMINDRITVSEAGIFSSKGIDRQARGEIVYMADLSGFTLLMVAPQFTTPVTWNIRDDAKLAGVIRMLHIDEVVLCSLTGGLGGPDNPAGAVESLRALANLNVPVTYEPSDGESVCPRRNLQVDGEPCGDGYKKGAEYCQACIDKNGSPFGRVDVSAWWLAWSGLLTKREQANAAD